MNNNNPLVDHALNRHK